MDAINFLFFWFWINVWPTQLPMPCHIKEKFTPKPKLSPRRPSRRAWGHDRVRSMVTGSPRNRELSPKLSGSFHPSCDLEPLGLTGRDSEAFLATCFFSGTFYQTRRPEKATLLPKMINYAISNCHSGNN